MINAAGMKVWPAEVEAAMYRHPAIKECCIIASPDERRGETVKLVVVLKEEFSDVTGEEILSWSQDADGGLQGARASSNSSDALPRTGLRQADVARAAGKGIPMITVHHLNDSRSQRILWLLEELGLPYEIKHYKRLETRLAPPELKAIHPVGKSPVITDGSKTVYESGAIIDYVIRRHAGGRLQPDPATPAYDDYQMWMHYAEGSAMLPLMLNLYVSRLGEGGAPLHPRIESEIANHLGYLDGHLKGRDFLRGRQIHRRRHPDELRRGNRRGLRQARRVPEPRRLDQAPARAAGVQEGARKRRALPLRQIGPPLFDLDAGVADQLAELVGFALHELEELFGRAGDDVEAAVDELLARSGLLERARMSRRTRAVMSFGTPTGASRPNQETISMPGKVSPSVGMSGICARRFRPPVAMPFTLPDFRCGRISGVETNAMSTCWPSSAWMSGPPPL